MPALFVTCHRCHFEFPSGFALTGPLGTLSVFGVRHRCPRCGTEAGYYTPEYHLAADALPGTYHSAEDYRLSKGSGAADDPPSSARRSDLTARTPYGWIAGFRTSL